MKVRSISRISNSSITGPCKSEQRRLGRVMAVECIRATPEGMHRE